ncbi:DUF6950 family protein [Oryzifoliimicrobium ureilyticus]|uniref:DUF6950 family protein n=1 Tax=Oryzifoliimicrobium ureilyticus TaxID=3113724 RepID=UPI003075F060
MDRIVRINGWYERLHDYVERVRRQPFQYGTHDCGLFTAGAIEAMTGFDPAQGLRGRYKTFKGGLKLLKKLGWSSHADMAATLFSEEVHPSHAQLGDIAAIEVDGDTGIALGVVSGAHILVVQPDKAGVGIVDLLRASRAWRVPAA